MKETTIDLDARYDKIPILARKLLDVPFLLFGRDPNVGIDCVGVMALAAAEAGFHCPSILRREASDRRALPLLDAIQTDLFPVYFNEIRIGDVLWFRIPGALIDHFAIVTDTNPIKMVHTNPLTLGDPTEQLLTDIMLACYPSMGSWDRWLQCAFRFAKLSVDPEIERVILVSNMFGRKSRVLKPAENHIIELAPKGK
jgi:cell wall-associated NlpC family hydrolase